MGAPGFDDAPLVRVNAAPVKTITLVYPYYENPEFLQFQLKGWADYPGDLRRSLRIIVVDDGSPISPAEPIVRHCLGRLPLRFDAFELYRIDVDVRWNWLAARNIGMHHAADGWCLMTDMDHVVTGNTLSRILSGDHKSRTVYRFSRREHTGQEIHPHPNSMLIERSMFWKVGGYDEALSGFYGTDGDWRRRVAKAAHVLTLTDELVRYEFHGDSSTRHYKRKQAEDAGKKAIIAKRGPNWRPKTLSFPYRKIIL